MALPQGFNSEWAVEQLDRYLALTVPQRASTTAYKSIPTGKRDDVLAQSAVIAPILTAVIPNWRFECGLSKNYEFAQEREAAIRAKSLLEREHEMAQNLGEADPGIAPSRFHPWVWEPARSLWTGGHYRGALQTAATSLDNELRALCEPIDISGMVLIQQLLSEKPPEQGRPRLDLPTTGNVDNDRSLRNGLRGLGEACFSLIRNLTTHNLVEIPEQEALEQMAVLSLLARFAERFGVIRDQSPP